MVRFVFLSFLLFFILASCSQKGLMMSVDFNKNTGIILSFESPNDTCLFLDLKAFTSHCFNQEKKWKDEYFSYDYNQISDILEFNQVLLIDQDNKKRFLTQYFALPNEGKDLPSINCSEEWIAKINLKRGDTEKIKIDYNYVSDLMSTENSSKVKLVYIGKNEGKGSLILESNWINL